MSKKIIFFDVDGTLVDVRPVKECIPESTIQAVHETRKKGNLCYLCTGRSLAEIYPYILDVGFDGIIGATRLVLHPGAHVKAGDEAGLDAIVSGLNEAMKPDQKVHIALETMAGKGTELGRTFDQLAYIIDHCDYPELLGLCLDTCHLNDAGYDISDFDAILDEVDEKIGLDKVLVVHVNDSKNPQGSHKDRHENIGFGTIGFDTLDSIVSNERLKDVPKILETPYIEKNAPYKEEIEMLKKHEFNPGLKEMFE